jgi:hypothetical protein
MPAASSSSDRQNPPAPPRRSRLLLKLALGALLVLVLLVAAAPTLLSSGPGRNLIQGMANERVAGTVAIDDLSLRWFGPQRIAGLRLADPAGDPVVTVAEFKTGLSLLQALRGRLGLGETLIRGLRVELALDPSGQDNLDAAIGLAQEPGAPSGPLLIPVTGDLVLEQGYLSWSVPGIEPLIIEDLAARVRLDPSSRDLVLDLSGRSRQGDMSGSLAVSGTLRQWLDARGRLTLASMDPELQLRIEALPLRLVDRLAGLDGLLVAALGQQLSVRLASSERQLDLKGESPLLAVDLAADLRDLRFALTRPAALRWTLTPELVARLAPGSPFQLRTPADLELRLTAFSAPRPVAGEALLQPQRTRLEASFRSKALELVDREGLRSRLADLRLDLGGASLAALTLEGSGRLSQTPPGPLALIEASPLALDLNLRSGLGPQGRIEPLEGRIQLRGGALEATLPFQVSAGLETLALTAPAQVSVPLTPAMLARWLDAETPASGQIRLAEAAPVRLVLERLEAGLADPGLAALQFDGSAAIGRMRFRSGSQVLAALDQLDVGLQWQGSQGRAAVSVDGRVSADGGEPGVINGSLALDSLRPDGSGNLNLDLVLTQLPLVVVDRFLGMDGMVTATLGRTMEGTLQGELREGQGPLTLGIRGSNARADLKAHWNQGSLTLREPLMAEVQPTPEFGRLVLARLHPLFETLLGGEEPFRFIMPAEGVLIPLIDFDLKNVRVPEMRLSLGRVELASGWLLQGLVTVGQRFGTLRSVGDRWPAEFTPAVVSVADGQLTFTRRMDVLLGDQMHLATWGAMDLMTQRADLVLGVMPLTLRSVFSVAAAEDDALRIAVRGQPGPGAVDFSSIGIELARLQAQRRLGGGSLLLGALLGTVTGSTPGLSGAPAPSVSPLPWAERLK